jgi:hypothetical protein
MGKMKRAIIAMAFLMVVGAPAAMAQGQNSGSSMSKGSGGPPQAPVGHRQPRAGDVPNEKNLSDPNNPVNKEDAILDKKIRSICRGC